VNQRTEGILLIILMIALSLIFQVQMKQFAASLGSAIGKAQHWSGAVSAVVAASLSWRGLLIVVLAGLAFLLWLLALMRLELSFALPIASISYLISALGGGLWLGEQLSWIRVLGLVTTAIGIWLVVKS
jgi:drug/metabolite transporter (DMT)-like permease